MISQFQLVTLSFEERLAWEFEQEQLRGRGLAVELNPLVLLNLSIFLMAATLLAVLGSFT